MSKAGAGRACGHGGGYRHEAFLYDGDDAFLDGVVPFIRAAGASGEAVLVVLPAPKLALTREALGRDADGVLFADMGEVGANPARIIPAWRRFLGEHAGEHGVRGVGEPLSATRTPAELVECERHEALLNIAFAGADFWLLCPYDTGALAPAVVEAARRNHPVVRGSGTSRASASFPGAAALSGPFDEPLPAPPADALVLGVGRTAALHELRGAVARYAADAGLSEERTADLVLAAGELVTNTLVHGGGRGTLRLWREPDAVVCEVRDRGRFDDPLAGRVAPPGQACAGRGLWMANQVCELVQVRSFPEGTTVRVRKRYT